MEVKCYLKAKKLIEPILLFVFDENLACFVTFYFDCVLYQHYSKIIHLLDSAELDIRFVFTNRG